MERYETGQVELIGVPAAAQMLGVSQDTLYKWITQRYVPHIKLGRAVRFDPKKLQEWIKIRSVMPMPVKR